MDSGQIAVWQAAGGHAGCLMEKAAVTIRRNRACSGSSIEESPRLLPAFLLARAHMPVGRAVAVGADPRIGQQRPLVLVAGDQPRGAAVPQPPPADRSLGLQCVPAAGRTGSRTPGAWGSPESAPAAHRCRVSTGLSWFSAPSGSRIVGTGDRTRARRAWGATGRRSRSSRLQGGFSRGGGRPRVPRSSRLRKAVPKGGGHESPWVAIRPSDWNWRRWTLQEAVIAQTFRSPSYRAPWKRIGHEPLCRIEVWLRSIPRPRNNCPWSRRT